MKSIYLFGALSLLFFSGCNFYPGSDARPDTLDVVITQYDYDADFSALKTYAISQEIKSLSANGQAPTFTIEPAFSAAVRKRVEANMAAYGWTLVDSTNNPDLAIDMGAIISRNTNVYNNSPGYGWGYPGYDWYYPWFSYPTVSSYKVGTLILVGLDFGRVDTVNQTIPVDWFALIQGPQDDFNNTDPYARIERDIDQAFMQSTYLNINP